MVTSPAGNRPAFSESAKRPMFRPSLQGMSRRNPDTGDTPRFGVRTTFAAPGSTPALAPPEIDMSDCHSHDHSHDHGKVHES
jgi:hypothetical protein